MAPSQGHSGSDAYHACANRRWLRLASADAHLSCWGAQVIDAAVEHPTVNATVWGPGWADYNANVSLTDNIRQRFGCAFDVTFAKLGAFTGGLRCASRHLNQYC